MITNKEMNEGLGKLVIVYLKKATNSKGRRAHRAYWGPLHYKGYDLDHVKSYFLVGSDIEFTSEDVERLEIYELAQRIE